MATRAAAGADGGLEPCDGAPHSMPSQPEPEPWQPRVHTGFPFALRIGATGLGAGAGCGFGIGLGRPLALGGLPVAGQAVQGLGAGLAPLQGVAAEARRRVLAMGLPGVDAGLGCGVGVGWGFFAAGVLVKPSAWEALAECAQRLAGSAADTVMSSLHSAGVTLPSQTPWLMGPTGTTGLAARSFAAPIRPGILSGGGAVSSLAHPEQLPGPGRTPPQADHLRQAKDGSFTDGGMASLRSVWALSDTQPRLRHFAVGLAVGGALGVGGALVYLRNGASRPASPAWQLAGRGSTDQDLSHPAIKFGIPQTEQLRFFSGFVSCLDGATRNPKWVLEHITKDSLKGEGTRDQSLFYEDPGADARFRSKLSDFQDSGYDRGHMAPAANHKASQKAMDETFALSNISPQVGVGFNRDYWARFEKFVKDVVRQSDGVYIVTGPLYLPTPEADPASGRTGWRMQYPLI
ncbi:endonuclease, partial [Monoraphidium neglectum]